MTIDYVVKKQAIDLHLQGRGRNEIARILNGQKMRISEATITHLIQAWNRQYQQQKHEHNNSEPFSQSSSLEATTVKSQEQLQSQPQPPQPPLQSQASIGLGSPSTSGYNASISTGIDMDNMRSPSSMVQKVHSGVGQANIETNSVAVKRNGGPFSHFLSEDMDTDTTTTVNPNPNPISIVKVTTPV